LIVMLNDVLALSPCESVTFTPKLLVPTAGGVPLMMPVFASKDIPEGRVPEVKDHVFAPVPPVEVNWALYAVF
jgi:hypothetical protein